jgi:hypothetical protein
MWCRETHHCRARSSHRVAFLVRDAGRQERTVRRVNIHAAAPRRLSGQTNPRQSYAESNGETDQPDESDERLIARGVRQRPRLGRLVGRDFRWRRRHRRCRRRHACRSRSLARRRFAVGRSLYFRWQLRVRLACGGSRVACVIELSCDLHAMTDEGLQLIFSLAGHPIRPAVPCLAALCRRSRRRRARRFACGRTSRNFRGIDQHKLITETDAPEGASAEFVRTPIIGFANQTPDKRHGSIRWRSLSPLLISRTLALRRRRAAADQERRGDQPGDFPRVHVHLHESRTGFMVVQAMDHDRSSVLVKAFARLAAQFPVGDHAHEQGTRRVL